MSIIKRNLVANLVSSLWMPILWLLVVPQYVALMGAEAFGLVGLFVAIQVLLSQFDLGLSMTLNRELARLSVREDAAGEMRDILRTLEAVYWGMAILVGALIVAVAAAIAQHWVKPQAMSAQDVRQAIMLMGAALACQWPLSLYSGGIMGLQRQVLLAVLNIVMYTVRFGGSLFVLWWVAPTIQAFFLWQAVAGLAHVALLGIVLWRALPGAPTPPAVRWSAVRSVQRFAAGLWAVAVIGTVASQADKAIVSRLVSLEMFGYYSLAALAAGGFVRVFSAVFSALYPRLSQFAAAGNEAEIKLLYHRGCQVVSAVALPLATVVILFPKEILLAWTRNPTVVREAWQPLALLVAGVTLNGMIYVPWSLQLAYGWTRLALYVNVAALAVLLPALYGCTLKWGLAGAATAVLIVNAGTVIAVMPAMHRRLLRSEMGSWCWNDLARPLLGGLVVAIPARLLFPDHLSRPAAVVALAGIAGAAILAGACAAPELRSIAREYLVRHQQTAG